MKVLGFDPMTRGRHGPARRRARRASSMPAHRRLRPALLHRDARHVLYRARPRRLDRRRPAAHRLPGKLQSARPQARRHPRAISASRIAGGHRCAPSPKRSACRRCGWCSSPSSPASCSATRRSGSRSTRPAATAAPPTMPASTPGACVSWRSSSAALCATMAGIIYVAFFRSFNPTAGQFRELDAIAAVIIGGGSIFGGYGTDHRLAGRRRRHHAHARAAAAQHHPGDGRPSSCRSTGSTSSSA